MPTFDFRCAKCNAMFEFARPFGSKLKPVCPECKSKKTEKMLSPPAIHFKGAGFYKTDTRTKTAPKKSESEKKAETPEHVKPAADAKKPEASAIPDTTKTSPQSPKKGV